VRSPKLYLRDSGLLHNLLGIETTDDLLAHPQAGESWEGFVIEQLIAAHPRWRPHFLRTSNGAELIAPVDQAFEARPGIWVRPPP
jgi:predicted AAA+ superfamily ATPase